jgi:hypothetical protein
MIARHVLFSILLLAQSARVEFFGVIKDPSGLPSPGATVELRNTATGAASSAITGPDGIYRFVALAPGNYDLTVRREGFSLLRRSGLTLRVGDQIPLDLTLSLGNLAQTVDVSGETPTLQSSRGTVSFTVEQEKVVTLPLDGRNFIPLIALSPGVMLPPASTLPRINGSRPRVSEYIYDGISVLQPEPGQVAYFPVIDAIQEFRVETNSYSAEYGRSNGGVIMVNHKSGSNFFHGTLFEFFRNEALNARNFFVTTGPKPRFRRNQYGFVLGGPIQEDKTFFFVDYQGSRLQIATPRTSTVPTSSQRLGIFTEAVFDPPSRVPFPANTIPSARWDPIAATLIERYPKPNVFTPSGAEATANNYVRIANEDTMQQQAGIRIDRILNSAQKLFGRYEYLYDHSKPSTPLPGGDGNITSGIIGDTRTAAQSLALEHAWTLNSRWVNQLRFGYTRRGFTRESLPGATFDIVGFQQLGPVPNGTADFSTSVTQVVDNLSWSRGRQGVKMGADIRIEHLDVLQPPSPAGLFQFTRTLTSGFDSHGVPSVGGNAFASYLLGQVQAYTIDIQQEMLKPRAKIAEFFIQDDFRASDRLSFNAGLRYTLNLPSTIEGDRGAVFNLATQQLDYFGKNGYPRTARNLEWGNIAARMGLAFRFSDNSVVRSGYGITWIEQAGITTPFTTPLFPFVQTAGQRSPDNIFPAFVLSQGPSTQVQDPHNPNIGLGQGVFGVNREQKSGYAQQWNLSVQNTFGKIWSFEVGYLGSKLTNLGVPDVNLNQLTVEQLAQGSALTQSVVNPYFGEIPASSSIGGPTITRQQLLRPFPRFTTVALYRNNVGHSTYHSFQSRVEKRLSHGFTLNASYTFSRLIDDAGAVFDAAILTGPAATFQVADSHNRRAEKDHSSGSIPQVFSGSFVWNVPLYGLQLAGLFRAQSGSPLAVTQATNANAFAGFGIQRPNRIADPQLPDGERTISRWFNTAAFTAAPQFTLGNASRNPVVGPGYRTLDVMLGKTFVLREDFRLELRAEAFNVTNTPSFAAPNTSFGTAAFGTITRAFDPRVFELVAKAHF